MRVSSFKNHSRSSSIGRFTPPLQNWQLSGKSYDGRGKFERKKKTCLKSHCFKAGLEDICPKKQGDYIIQLVNLSKKNTAVHQPGILLPSSLTRDFCRKSIPRHSPQERYYPGYEPSFARFVTKSDTWYQISTMRLCSSAFFGH